MTINRVIGVNQGLPWHLPEDLQLFRRLTMGGTIIMGHKTHSSIGRPLSGRHNIVLSRTRKELPGVQVCDSFNTALAAAAQCGRPVFIIGGEVLYRQALPIADELHISWVKASAQGDLYFPEFDLADWTTGEKKEYSGFLYIHYLRRNKR